MTYFPQTAPLLNRLCLAIQQIDLQWQFRRRSLRHMNLMLIRDRLEKLANPDDAQQLARFFKTGPGHYGQGDRFRGIRQPPLRALAQDFHHLSFAELDQLLASEYHEDRMLALLIVVDRFERAGRAGRESDQAALYEFYVAHLPRINNWDLVDVSAPHVVGTWLCGRDRASLRRWAASPSVWERRIAILATMAFIRRGEFDDTLALAEQLLDDPHDLIHKAAGWMLREVGKRDEAALESFLRRFTRRMPRTMLRYAIERLPEPRRQEWLQGATH